MAARSNRPELQAPDLSATIRPHGGIPHRTAPDDPRFAAAEQLETHDAVIRGMSEGRVKVVNPDTLPMSPQGQAPVVQRRRGPETSLSTKVPEDVMQQLRLRYAETGVTIRNQILIALRKDGIKVSDDDIQDERKRPRH